MLELVVVLLLAGLVTTLAMPNLERLTASITRQSERDRILDQIAGLGRWAMLQGRSYVVFGSGRAYGAGASGPVREAGDMVSGEPPDGSAGSPTGHPSHADLDRHVVDLPEGWEIRLDPPLVIRANGVCLGAGLTLRHRGAVDTRIDLEPPYCRIDVDA